MAAASGRAVCCVAAVLLGVAVVGETPGDAAEPTFLAPLENHTVTQGRDVHFTCSVNHLSNYRVAWIKSDSKAILAIHTSMVALDPRLSVTYNGHNTWRLHVAGVRANDSGTYMCQVNTDPMKSQMGHLAVVIPPDIVDSGGGAGGGGGEAAAVREGGSVRLTCRATGVPPPAVLWKRDRGKYIVFRPDHAAAAGGARERRVSNYSGEVLVLPHVLRSDMGSYYCIASNGVPPAVSRRYRVLVHFVPSIRVSSQLVGAPLGSRVQLQCCVEASPRAMTAWYRDNGDKVAESSQFVVAEASAGEYTAWSNLTVRALRRPDVGGYVCVSANALGRVEAAVTLHELELPERGADGERARGAAGAAAAASSLLAAAAAAAAAAVGAVNRLLR